MDEVKWLHTEDCVNLAGLDTEARVPVLTGWVGLVDVAQYASDAGLDTQGPVLTGVIGTVGVAGNSAAGVDIEVRVPVFSG